MEVSSEANRITKKELKVHRVVRRLTFGGNIWWKHAATSTKPYSDWPCNSMLIELFMTACCSDFHGSARTVTWVRPNRCAPRSFVVLHIDAKKSGLNAD